MYKTLVKLYIKIIGHYPSLGQEIRYDILSDFIDKGKRYLDIGCGTGELLLKNKYKFKELYGVDLTDERFGIYREDILKNGIHLLREDATNLSCFQNGFFDVISISEVLEHTESYRNILSEIFRLLLIGGKLCLTVPGPHDIVGKYKNIGHTIPGFSYLEIKKELENIGFVVLQHRFFGGLLTNWITELGTGEHPILSALLFPIGWILFKTEKIIRRVLPKFLFTYGSPGSGIFILCTK